MKIGERTTFEKAASAAPVPHRTAQWNTVLSGAPQRATALHSSTSITQKESSRDRLGLGPILTDPRSFLLDNFEKKKKKSPRSFDP